MELPSSVTLCEVGLRDGLQNEKVILSTTDKLELLRGVIDAGFHVVEVGAFSYPRLPQLADTDRVFRRLGRVNGVELQALAFDLRGMERAIACGCRKVKLGVTASRCRSRNNSPEQSVSALAPAVEAAAAKGVAVAGYVSMPFASPWEGRTPVKTVDAITEAFLRLGVSEISLSDTPGLANPTQVKNLCSHLREKYPTVSWWLHFHNTRGLALANILAAMASGMTRFDTAFGGLGGCPFVPGAAGNVASEDVVHMFDEMGVDTGIDVVRMMALSRRLSQRLGHSMDSYVLKAGRSVDLLES